MIPEMIFKIDLNGRIGMREIDEQKWKTIHEMGNSIEENVSCVRELTIYMFKSVIATKVG